VLSSAPGIQGQGAWERLRAAPGQVQLGTRIRLCTERVAGRCNRLPERRSVPPACPCPGALWAMPSMLCSHAGPALQSRAGRLDGAMAAAPSPAQGPLLCRAHRVTWSTRPPLEFITTSPQSWAGSGGGESGPSGSQ